MTIQTNVAEIHFFEFVQFLHNHNLQEFIRKVITFKNKCLDFWKMTLYKDFQTLIIQIAID